MICGFHSKNATFSIRNYLNGALLYYKHLCQRGGDEDDLYLGTSKWAEGFAAQLTFKRAKDEGMKVEVHWQDTDSSSSNAVRECFPEAKTMICGGPCRQMSQETTGKTGQMQVFFQRLPKEALQDISTDGKGDLPL